MSATRQRGLRLAYGSWKIICMRAPERELGVDEIDAPAGEPDFPARRPIQADDQPRDRRLAAAGFADQSQGLALGDRQADAVDRLEDLPRLAFDQAVEPRRRDVEIAGDVDQLEQRRAHARLAAVACSQHAARLVAARISSGRSPRQRSKAYAQRGWNAQPDGTARQPRHRAVDLGQLVALVDDRRDRAHQTARCTGAAAGG